MKKSTVVMVSFFAVILLIISSQTNIWGYHTVQASQNTIKTELKTFSNDWEKGLISVKVLEYKSDGTVVESYYKLSQEQVNCLQKELKRAKDWNVRLSIYQNYKLISANVTWETINSGMVEKAKRSVLTDEILRDTDGGYFVINRMCKAEGWYAGTSTFLGMSVITARWNCLANILGVNLFLPSADLAHFGLGMGYIDTSDGVLPDAYGVYNLFFQIIVGFVGYVVFIVPGPLLRIIQYLGSCRFVLAGGFPNEWDPGYK